MYGHARGRLRISLYGPISSAAFHFAFLRALLHIFAALLLLLLHSTVPHSLQSGARTANRKPSSHCKSSCHIRFVLLWNSCTWAPQPSPDHSPRRSVL